MLRTLIPSLNYSINYSEKMLAKLSYKVNLKTNYIKSDGTCAIYVQIFVKKKKKIFHLDLNVLPTQFDKIKQRVNSKHPNHKDYNLIIEKFLAELNTIEINYRLSGEILDIEKLTNEIQNPTSWICFIAFWKEELERQKHLLITI